MSLKDILTIEQANDSSVSVDFKAMPEHVYVEAESEWYGDTETGFGATVGVELNRNQVEQVIHFLSGWLVEGKTE